MAELTHEEKVAAARARFDAAGAALDAYKERDIELGLKLEAALKAAKRERQKHHDTQEALWEERYAAKDELFALLGLGERLARMEELTGPIGEDEDTVDHGSFSKELLDALTSED